ncbi:MAG TPA: hypothetical protein VGK41_01705 [Solirubrobacterales bacterium]
MNEERAGNESFSDRLKTIAGLVAVTIGVIAVASIALYAICKSNEDAATIASASGGVIASIVGAYFGVKIGADQSKNAQNGLKEEAAKAQVYAAHLLPDEADAILGKAQDAARSVRL